jgi:ADP-ribosylglycohydrolase
MGAVPTLDRVAGSLLGQCLGDALGFAVEGHGPDECAFYVHEILRAGKAGRIGRPPFPFGQYTDDSQLARELLLSLVERRGFDPDDYARRLALIFAADRVVGRGRATEEAAQRLARGVPWDQAGTPAPSAGNGGAMRAAPAGIWHYDDLGKAANIGSTQALMTHQDPRARAGAAAVAVATAQALRSSEPLDMAQIATYVRPHHEGFGAAIGQLEPCDADVAYQSIQRLSANLGGQPDGWRGVSPFVVPSVLWSLYAALKHTGSYWDAVCLAIEVGGDVDTTAAMTGAIVGARVGLGGLPGDLLDKLTDQGTWTRPDLVELARRAREQLSARG